MSVKPDTCLDMVYEKGLEVLISQVTLLSSQMVVFVSAASLVFARFSCR